VTVMFLRDVAFTPSPPIPLRSSVTSSVSITMPSVPIL
jgi:hypothetical protein